MRIQRTSQILSTIIIVLSILAVGCTFWSKYYRGIQEAKYETRRRMSNLTLQLATASDRLTSSVRAYAATGDRRFYDEFQRELTVDRNRDLAIEGLKQLDLPSQAMDLITRAKRSSDNLVLLENQALAAVATNDLARAVQIVYGTDYETAKASITGPINDFRIGNEERLTSEALSFAGKARVLATIALGTMILNTLIVATALLLFYRRRVINPLAHLNLSLRALVAGKSEEKIGYQNDSSEIGEVARSMETYRRTVNEADQQQWVKTSVAEIADILQDAEDPAEFGKRLLSTLVPMVGGGCAAFHLFQDSDGRFYFTRGYGCSDRYGKKGFAPGEGVAGQAAVERKPIVLSEIPVDYARIESGVGDAPPRALTVIPINSRERVLAIIEIASFSALTNQQRLLLDEVAAMVALKLEILQRNRRTRELLEQVRVSEERSRLILESTAEGIFGVDRDGRIGFVNTAACRFLGYQPEEMIGQDSHSLLHHKYADGRDYPLEKDPMYAAYTRGEIIRTDQEVLWRKDGTNIPVEYGATPVCKEGAMLGAVISFSDIQDRKRAEAELVSAKKRAEEATEMKSMFLANMSHEIRTPMNAIIGLSHLALKTSLSPKQRDYISKVHNAGTSLLAVINDILDFSKIEAGKLDLETIDFKLDEVISSVTTLTAQKAHEKGLEFLAHIAPGIPENLLGDPLRLGQILTNFVNNAVKFTERGEIRAEIELLERMGEKAQLKFSVRDTGIGMTREQAARLFQPFTQADMSTTRKHGGTGLGLTICKRLVELMGGRIWLQSEPGQGSAFYFTVWVGIGRVTPSARRVPERLAKLRVLVVDDNPAAREILKEPLANLTRTVDTVASGREALVAIQQQDPKDPYDIIFMDWRMPGMDGLQTSRHIKCDETLGHQPAIVLVTAFGREEVREEAERLQLDGFLVKPVTKSMIVDTLVNVFAEETGEAESIGRSDAGRLRGAQILLTEDNEINQQIAIELLEGAGAKVTVANNGKQAVEILSKGPDPVPFDLVLMDLQMPEMDGYQATSKLRSEPRFKSLPIVAMTAHATIEERARCLAVGMNEHISKPIDPPMLFDTIAKFLHIKAPQPTARHEPAKAAVASSPVGDGEMPTIAGLDTSDGLSRVAGNRKLYTKLLQEFAEQQGVALAEISSALARGDVPLAERLAHTLKGVAGNIGAKSIQTAAGALEKLIRTQANQAEIESAMKALGNELVPVVTKLLTALDPGGAAPVANAKVGTATPAECKEAGQGLLKLLAEFDAGAADFLEANQSALRTLLGAEEWPEFEKLVQGYGFSDAQERLELAMKAQS